MIKSTLLSLLLLFKFSSNIKLANECYGSIPWQKDRLLTWEDFQGSLTEDQLYSDYAAVTTAKIRIESFYRNEISSFRICNLFIKDKSAKSRKTSDALLNHEQMHFNISEIFTRRMRKSVDSLSMANSVEDVYWEVLKKHYILKDAYQDSYDEETDFGRNINKQKLWDHNIKSELSKLDIYYISDENESCVCNK